MDNRRSFILKKINELEQELKVLSLWSDHPLTDEQMASTAPFGCDVMDLHQWLQHIFIPKFKILIESDQSLPSDMNIASMAEYVYRDDLSRHHRLILILKSLDRAVKV